MKVAEGAAQELPLNDEKMPEKKNRHVTVAVNHLTQRRDALMAQRDKLAEEIKGIDSALVALK